MKTKRKRLVWLLVPVFLLTCGAVYVLQYYHADETALSAMRSDADVTITQTAYGWFFDGPSETDALVFYPGGKVEETAYAPLLHALAADGMDVLLVKMPFRLAVLNINKAEKAVREYDYAHLYMGGHSLGGVCAADYAAAHADRFDGLILLASYPAKMLPDTLKTVLIYGSADGVLNMEKYAQSKQNAPQHEEYVIDGGNHAQFGAYGLQKGDGAASVSAEEQIRVTVQEILHRFGAASLIAA